MADTQRVTNSWGGCRSMRATVECLTCGKSQTVDQEDGGFAIDQWPCECGDSECKRRVCRNCPECDRHCGLPIAPECSVEYSGKVLCRECMSVEREDAAAEAEARDYAERR